MGALRQVSCTYGPCYYDLGTPSTAGGKGVCVFWGKPAYLRDAMDVTKKMQILDAARFASKYGNIEDLIVIEGTVTELNTQSQHYCATASTPLITTWDLNAVV